MVWEAAGGAYGAWKTRGFKDPIRFDEGTA